MIRHRYVIWDDTCSGCDTDVSTHPRCPDCDALTCWHPCHCHDTKETL